MEEKFVEVWGPVQLPGLSAEAGFSRNVPWPGGRGWFVVSNFSASVGVALNFTFVGPQSPQVPPGLTPIDASGVYPFDLPAGLFEIVVNPQIGDNVSWDFVRLVRIP